MVFLQVVKRSTSESGCFVGAEAIFLAQRRLRPACYVPNSPRERVSRFYPG